MPNLGNYSYGNNQQLQRSLKPLVNRNLNWQKMGSNAITPLSEALIGASFAKKMEESIFDISTSVFFFLRVIDFLRGANFWFIYFSLL